MDRRTFLATLAATTGMPAAAFAQGRAKPEIQKLTMGFGLDPVFAPHILAMKKGWFTEIGFTEIATKTFTAGALAGEALIAGEIQLWTPGNLPPISMAHTGVPIVVLGTNCVATAAEKLVARTDAKITKPDDLYRIKIGLLAGSTASATLHNLAKHYKLDEKRLQVVNMPPPEQLAALNSNQIQALLCWQPWGNNALKTGNAEMIHSGTVSGFATNKFERVQISATRSLFVASQDFVRKNPVATRLMMGVLLVGQRYILNPSHRREVVRLVAEETKQDEQLVSAIWDEYFFDATIDDRYVADMQSMTNYLVASGRVKSPKHPLDYTFTDPLAAIDRDMIKLNGRWKA
jgi:ABC-type nitrate/sulfonate/bicarbonate transport system substrate-binding protein